MSQTQIPRLAVDDVFNSFDALRGREVELVDFIVARCRERLNHYLCWMLSERWLDASSNGAKAVVDFSRAIRLCSTDLPADLVEAVGPCGGWPIDAYAVAKVRGTLVKGTTDFPYDLIRVESVLVEGREVLGRSSQDERSP